MDQPIPDSCQVLAWRPPVGGIHEVFHARISAYRYPLHCHHTWTVLIVDAGAIRYDLDARERDAAVHSVTILPPGVPHDGGPARRWGGFHKRNLYLDDAFLPPDLVAAAVDSSTFVDPTLRAAISALHDVLLDHPEELDVEHRLALIAERFARRLRPRAAPPRPAEPHVAARLRELLDGHLVDRVTLADAAAVLDRSVAHLVRSFSRSYGISPHAYVIGRRVERARARLLDGVPPGQVAVEVGFHDQAHLSRHFKRHVSVPPATYAAAGVAAGSRQRWRRTPGVPA